MKTSSAQAQQIGVPPGPLDAQGAGAPPPRRPLESALKNVIDVFIDSRSTPNTREAYRIALEGFIMTLDITTHEKLLAVRSADVVRYRNRLQERKLAPSTINQHLSAVRGLYRRLLREHRIGENPADPELVAGPRVSQESRTEGLSIDEVKAMIGTCQDGTLRGLRDRALLVTLYYEGLRRSEASKLNYRDLTTKRGLLEVRDAKNNPYAAIRLRSEAREAIEGYLECLNRELKRLETRPEDPVFVSLSHLRSFGERLAPNSINKIVKARARAAGIRHRVHAHVLRHTCTTHALAAGAPLYQVQRHLRHKDVRTTLRYDRDRDVRKNPTLDLMPPVILHK